MIHDNDYPLVTFLIKKSQYAISAKYVSNMVAVPATRPVPHAPPYVRGLINLRGKVLPLIDLRIRLGYRSHIDETSEFSQMLEFRKQEHIDWIHELERSVHEEREFKLTSDPHQYAFGKWYDSYETEDLSAQALLRKFARPHERIHSLAKKVEDLKSQRNFEGALEMISQSRDNELVQMVDLFDKVHQYMREFSREIAMIVEAPQFDYAVAIDEVQSVEFLAPGTTEKLPVGLDARLTNNLVTLIGRRVSDNSSVQILDSLRICDPDDVKGLELHFDASQENELQTN